MTTQRIPVFALFGETSGFPDVLHCERIRDRAQGFAWRISPHRHAQMAQVLLIEEGEARAGVDGALTDLPPQSLLHLPQQCVHSFDFAPGTEGAVVSLPAIVLRSLGPETGDVHQALSVPRLGPASGTALGLIGMLFDIMERSGTYRTQAATGLAHALLAEVACLPGLFSQTAQTDHMAGLDALLRRHMGDGWRASDYAAALSMTTGHLSRLCRAAKGVGVQSYIEQAQMTEACRYLAFTQVTVAQIGYRLGFGDPSYFSRRFRAVTGQTPSAYRSAYVTAANSDGAVSPAAKGT